MKKDLDDLVSSLVQRVLAGDVKRAGALWKNSGGGRVPRNFTSKRPYSGINLLVLWLASMDNGYKTHHWTTLAQCNKLGGSIKKGEKGEQVIVWSPKESTKKNAKGEDVKERRLFHRFYTVFNLDQTTLEVPEVEASPVVHPPSLPFLLQRTEALGVTYIPNGDGAYYKPSKDSLTMPPIEDFYRPDDYCAVLAHEIVHSTGHETRLKRNFDRDKNNYAFEELIAELGAAFLCAELGIDGTYESHLSYLDSWSAMFKDKASTLMSAASRASKAFELILGENHERETADRSGSEVGDGVGAVSGIPVVADRLHG